MHRNWDVTHSRLQRLLRRQLEPRVYREAVPLDATIHVVAGEPISHDVGVAGEYVPCPPGTAWGPAFGTAWFRFRGAVPESWAGEEVVARVELGFQPSMGLTTEGLVWSEGRTVQGLSVNHRDFVVAAPARGGEAVDFHVEAASNPIDMSYRTARAIGTNEWPDPDATALRCTFGGAELAVVDQPVRALLREYAILLEMAERLADDEPRKWEIAHALTEVCNRLDPDDVSGTAEAARRELAGVLARPAVPSAHVLTAVGQAHIDTAWLWPLRETHRKVARTFTTVMALMDRYPEYRFAASQPLHYQWVREEYPELYERMRARIAEGRFEPVGSMWIEPDCNVPSGESLVRQLLHGKRYFLREFGVETTDVWLPDVFGYSAAMPQIMVEAGVDTFMTTKMQWSQYNQFPHNNFLWEGIDGTRIFTHIPSTTDVNGNLTAGQVMHASRNFRDHGSSSRSLLTFGYGDGGGGPEPRMLDNARIMADLEGLPRVQMGTVREHYELTRAEVRNPALWVGELYLELHRGTYTSQARIKRLNRRLEQALRAAELWWTVQPQGPARYPRADLERLWKVLLLHQFHDILPGSSINRVHVEAEAALSAALDETRSLAETAMTLIAPSTDEAALTVFNATAHARREVVNVAPDAGQALAPASETAVGNATSQRSADGTRLVMASAPACGYAVLRPGESEGGAAAAVPPPVAVEGNVMENGHLRVTWDDDGLLVSVFDLDAQREVLAGRGNLLQLHHDRPNDWEAWDVDLHYRETVRDLTELTTVEVLESGPLRASVRIVRPCGTSTITQEMRLCAGSRRLDFVTHVDWHEERKFLKVAFPVAVHAVSATYEIQFGHVSRATHANTSWDLARFEVCGHRWADLSEAGYGVALLNDSKYGYDISGNVMRLSLLRSSRIPDPLAEIGDQHFTYSLLPHTGDAVVGGVIAAAEDLNQPLQVVVGVAPQARHSYFGIDGYEGAVIDTVKRAEDSDHVVVRIYEAHGGRGTARLRYDESLVGAQPTARGADLLERPRAELPVGSDGAELELTPFKLLTVLLDPVQPQT